MIWIGWMVVFGPVKINRIPFLVLQENFLERKVMMRWIIRKKWLKFRYRIASSLEQVVGQIWVSVSKNQNFRIMLLYSTKTIRTRSRSSILLRSVLRPTKYIKRWMLFNIKGMIKSHPSQEPTSQSQQCLPQIRKLKNQKIHHWVTQDPKGQKYSIKPKKRKRRSIILNFQIILLKVLLMTLPIKRRHQHKPISGYSLVKSVKNNLQLILASVAMIHLLLLINLSNINQIQSKIHL